MNHQDHKWFRNQTTSSLIPISVLFSEEELQGQTAQLASHQLIFLTNSGAEFEVVFTLTLPDSEVLFDLDVMVSQCKALAQFKLDQSFSGNHQGSLRGGYSLKWGRVLFLKYKISGLISDTFLYGVERQKPRGGLCSYRWESLNHTREQFHNPP